MPVTLRALAIGASHVNNFKQHQKIFFSVIERFVCLDFR